jgi:hypothetical protein
MADLIGYLEHGQAAEAGTNEELLSRGGRYAELSPSRPRAAARARRTGALCIAGDHIAASA